MAAAGIRHEGVVFCGADFRRDGVVEILEQAGYSRSAASLFVCEGILVYLDSTVIERLLADLSRTSPPESRLVASLATCAPEARESVLGSANARRRAGRTEPWRTILPFGDHLRLLERCGWTTLETTTTADSGADARDPGAVFVVSRPMKVR